MDPVHAIVLLALAVLTLHGYAGRRDARRRADLEAIRRRALELDLRKLEAHPTARLRVRRRSLRVAGSASPEHDALRLEFEVAGRPLPTRDAS